MNRKLMVDDRMDEELEDEGVVAKKKEKKRKSKEEKGRDRKVVFWVMIIIVLTTVGFWLKAVWEGKTTRTLEPKDSRTQDNEVIDNEFGGESGFFVKYKI